jgi:glycine cleavage system H lipoate-binding protein
MLARISTSVLTKIPRISIGKRNLCWIKQDNGIYSIGLTRKTVEIYQGINFIDINKNTFVKFNHELCFIESDKFVESINSPFDCKIIKKNKYILDTINIDSENKEHSWIVKVEPIIFGNSIDVSLSQTLQNYFNNYRNSQSIPDIQVAHL